MLRLTKAMGYGSNKLVEFEHSRAFLEFLDYDDAIDELEDKYSNEKFFRWLDSAVFPDSGMSVLGRVADVQQISYIRTMRNYILDSKAPVVMSTIIKPDSVLAPNESLVLAPLTLAERWIQLDNPIDLQESRNRMPKGAAYPEDRFTEINEPIFPYCRWANMEGVVQEVHESEQTQILLDDLKHVELESKNIESMRQIREELKPLIGKLGFENPKDYLAGMHPMVPLEIELVLLWMEIFPNSQEIQKAMRPCIIEYWD